MKRVYVMGVITISLIILSFLNLTLILLNIFPNINIILYMILTLLITLTIVFSITSFLSYRSSFESIKNSVKIMSEAIKNNERVIVDNELFNNLVNEINELIAAKKELQSENDRIKLENYSLRDYLLLLEKGEILFNFDISIQEVKNLVSKVESKLSRLFDSFFNIIFRFSYSLYKNTKNMYYVEFDVNEIISVFSELKNYIDVLSKYFVKLSEKLNEFLNLSFSSYQNFDKFFEISSSLESSWSKFYSVSGEVVKINKEMYNEITEIMNLAKVISEISEQTLILAMNALIESSKIGEAGKGFVVIADEIRRLSENVAKFSKNISEKLQTVKGKSNTITISFEDLIKEGRVIEDSSKEIEKMSYTSKENFGKIIDSTEILSSDINTISYNIYQLINKLQDFNKRLEFVVNERIKPIELDLGSISEFLDDFRLVLSKNVKITSTKNLLSLALADHILWVSRLKGFLDGVVTIDEDVIFDHTKCRLGKWYYSEGISQFSDLLEFKAIEKPHERLHALGKEVVEIKEKNIILAYKKFEEIMKVSSIIVDNLYKLIERLSAEEYLK